MAQTDIKAAVVCILSRWQGDRTQECPGYHPAAPITSGSTPGPLTSSFIVFGIDPVQLIPIIVSVDAITHGLSVNLLGENCTPVAYSRQLTNDQLPWTRLD